MLVLVCYDVSTISDGGPKRLRRVCDVCKDYGVRVQYSVFECHVDAPTLVGLRARLLAEIDATLDNLRLYVLDEVSAERTEHFGGRRPIDVTGPLVM